MEEPEITVQDVKQQLQRIKEKKSPGPDGMKPDILKILGIDEQCTQVLTYVLNKIMRQEDMSPNSWAVSKTIMVPMKKKPTIRDLRPIALTNATYKLFMGILKSKVEHHMIQIHQESEVQAGFTRNRDTLLQVLKKYRIHPKIIDIIAHIYEKFKTQVYFNNMHEADIDVTSGIRQGVISQATSFCW